MIPDRRLVGGESANQDRGATVVPGFRRLDLHMISRTSAFQKNARRLAKIRGLELDRSRFRIRLGICPALGKARGVAALSAGQARHVLDIVEAVAEKREAEKDEQQRKQGRRPAALQALVKPDVDPIAAQTVNAVIRQTRWRARRFSPDRAHAIRDTRSDFHSPYGEGGHEQSQQDEGDRRTGIAVDPGRGEAWQERTDEADDVRDPPDWALELVGALR